MNIERYYKYLFTPTSILKCNFMWRLWFEMSFFKGCDEYDLSVLFPLLLSSLFVFKEAGLRSPPFLMSLGKEVSDQEDICSALTTKKNKKQTFDIQRKPVSRTW